MTEKLNLDFSDTVDVAIGKPATQSSYSAWSLPNESGRAVTGHRSGSFSFHTQAEVNPWWKADLQGHFPIEAIIVWNRDDEYAYRAKSICIEISSDDKAWVCLHRGLTYFGGKRTGRPLVHQLCGDLSGRYVKISLEGSDALHLVAVNVLVSKNLPIAEKLWTEWALPGEPTVSLSITPYTYTVRTSPGETIGSEVSALGLLRYGRFGNNFYQILHASAFALSVGITDIVLYHDALFAPIKDDNVAKLRYFSESEVSSRRMLIGNFFFVEAFKKALSGLNIRGLYSILTNDVAPLYRNLLRKARQCEKDTMHFHFRSGDIFSSSSVVHSNYLQPPLSFYKAALMDAVARHGIGRAVVVYEDRANPCVTGFEEYLRSISFEFRMQSSSLSEDLIELFGARVLCYGFGTFAEAIAALSSNISVLYAFRDVEMRNEWDQLPGCGMKELYSIKGLDQNVIRDANSDYIPKGGWLNTGQQREEMISFPQAGLEIQRIT